MNCNLCGQNNYGLLFETKRLSKERFVFSATSQETSETQIVKCKNCGLVYVNPQPEKHKMVSSYINAEDKNYVSDGIQRAASFKESLKKIKRFQKNGRVLDVGCAAGYFVHEAKKTGFEAVGLEPNKYLANWGRKNLKVDIINSLFEKKTSQNKQFDVITFWDVLEHLSDPAINLKKSAQLLKRGGILIISYPDMGSLPARILKSRWWFVISGHLFYFDHESLSQYMHKYGFEILEDSRYFPKLSLAYLIHQLGRYNKDLADKLYGFTKGTFLNNIAIHYWAGQRLMIAKKV